MRFLSLFKKNNNQKNLDVLSTIEYKNGMCMLCMRNVATTVETVEKWNAGGFYEGFDDFEVCEECATK